MDFELNEGQKMFQDTFRTFCENEIAPLVDEAEEKEKFPVELLPKMGKLGYLGITYPQQYGGAGVDKITDTIYCEELGRPSLGIGRSIMGHCCTGTRPIFVLGTEEQKQEYLVPAIKGEKKSCFALTEPNAGSDNRSMESTAHRDGDDYIINGTKVFASNSTFCDYVIVPVYTDKSKGHAGISIFIVDKGTPGFIISRKIPKESLRPMETTELNFEDCRVSKKNLIGEEEGSFPVVMNALSLARIDVGAAVIGLAQVACDTALNYAKERVQFGRPIGKFQAISFRLVDMATEIEAARLLVRKAAWLVDMGRNSDKLNSMCKLFASEVAVHVAREAIQIHGGYGFTRDLPLMRYLRDALTYTVGEGTSEIQRLIISRQLGL